MSWLVETLGKKALKTLGALTIVADRQGKPFPTVELAQLKGTDEWGINLGEERHHVKVRYRRPNWVFRFLDLTGDATPLTGNITVRSPEHLRTSRNAKPIRDVLKKQYADETLELVIGCIQDNRQKWLPTDEGEAEEGGDTRTTDLIARFISSRCPEPRMPIDYNEEKGLIYSTPVSLGGKRKGVFCWLENDFEGQVVTLNKQDPLQEDDDINEPSYIVLNEDYQLAVLSLYSEARRKREIPNEGLSEVFDELLSGIQYYLYMRDSRYYKLIACWIFGTYLFPMFYKYPYLEFRGPRRVGKTTALTLISQVAFNVPKKGKMVTPSEASLFRIVDACRPTQIVDEADYMRLKQFASMRAIVEAGFERGAVVPRVDKDDPSKISFCEAYSPRAFSCRGDLFLEDKSLPIIMEEPEDIIFSKRRSQLD